MSDWIGVTEAKEILGISVNTVKKLIREGILPAYEVPGVRGPRFHREDVEKLIRRIEPGVNKTTKPDSKKAKKRR